MNPNHLLEKGVRDACRAHYKYGHPRVARGVADQGGFYSAIDIGNPKIGKRTVPFTLISTGDAESIVPGLANYRLDLTISFMTSSSDNSLQQHEDWAAALGDWIDTEAWIDYLKDNGICLIYKPIVALGSSLEVSEEGLWATNWMYQLVMCPLV
jgi:hypothetical protein